MPSGSPIRTAARAADILLCFLDSPELRVTDVSARLSLDKGTTSRLLSTLAAKGLVQMDPLTRRYRLGPVIYDLGNAARGHTSLAHLALPSMTWLRDASGESVNLNVLVNYSRVCIAQVESQQDLRRVIEVGRPFPPYVGAAGRVLLAFLPRERQEETLERSKLQSFTPNTIADAQALMADLAEVRRQGYALGRGERVSGGAGVAVPVYGPRGEVVASLSVSLPLTHYDPDKLTDYLEGLRTAAGQISSRLGHFPQTADTGD